MNPSVLTSMLLALACTGCATSADMSYQYTRHSVECTRLTQEIARQKGDSKYKKSLNQRYYRDCVGN